MAKLASPAATLVLIVMSARVLTIALAAILATTFHCATPAQLGILPLLLTPSFALPAPNSACFVMNAVMPPLVLAVTPDLQEILARDAPRDTKEQAVSTAVLDTILTLISADLVMSSAAIA